MTRSPISALLIAAPAPIEQSRPIRTSGPITALAPITVPAPISARGPITAPGSTVTPSSSRAVGCTCAPGDLALPATARTAAARPEIIRAPPHEGAIGLAHDQHRHMRRHVLGKRRRGQAGAGMGRGGRCGVVSVVEESQMSDGAARSSGATLTMRRRARRRRRQRRAGQGGDLIKRETARCVLRISARSCCQRRAADRGRNQNFVPPLKRKICVRS